ncbi:MAG: hypothetical protein QOE01_531, partial [Actinomycetota bacterium]|nr:hypothetical protein [Actinomycetota bacterium]
MTGQAVTGQAVTGQAVTRWPLPTTVMPPSET